MRNGQFQVVDGDFLSHRAEGFPATPTGYAKSRTINNTRTKSLPDLGPIPESTHRQISKLLSAALTSIDLQPSIVIKRVMRSTLGRQTKSTLERPCVYSVAESNIPGVVRRNQICPYPAHR